MFHKKCEDRIAECVRRHNDDLTYYRSQIRSLQERNDRLVEALARKSDVPLQLPMKSYATDPAPTPDATGPTTDTGLNAWWAAVGNSPRIASPVKEKVEPAPNS